MGRREGRGAALVSEQGGMFAFGPCCVCRKHFVFNAARVPTSNGRPICLDCITEINARRRRLGMPEWEVYPDSYDELETRG